MIDLIWCFTEEIGLEICSLGPESSLSPDTKQMQYTGVSGLGRRERL